MTTVTCAHRQKTFCIDTLLDVRRTRTALCILSIRETFVSPRRAPALPTQRKLLFQLLLARLAQYRNAAAAKIPRRPNSLTTAEGEDRGPRGTISTRSHP